MNTDQTTVPTLTDGLTYLDTASPRTPALHQLTLATMSDLEGRVYWIDSRSTVSTYTWLEEPISPRRLDALQIARAFTAYQHHSLVQTAGERVQPGDLLVIPYLDALYADDDVPRVQARSLLGDTLEVLRTLADGGTAVAVTAGTPAFTERIADGADHTIVARETDLGIAFEGDDAETTLYRGPGFWQTTIPYWVELLGTCEAVERPMPLDPEPVQLALG